MDEFKHKFSEEEIKFFFSTKKQNLEETRKHIKSKLYEKPKALTTIKR